MIKFVSKMATSVNQMASPSSAHASFSVIQFLTDSGAWKTRVETRGDFAKAATPGSPSRDRKTVVHNASEK